MDIQQLMDAICIAGETERKRYHLTLGGLISAIEQNPSFDVVTDDGLYIKNPNSYRGYYSDLSFETSTEKPENLLEVLTKDTLNKSFEGYKSGEYVMKEDTPLWVAPYGDCGKAVIGYSVREEKIVLTTKQVD